MQKARRSRAPLALALGYVLLLLLVLLHRHPVHGFTPTATAASTQSAYTAIGHGSSDSNVRPVEDDCLLCNLLQLPRFGFVALLIAFVLRVSTEFFAVYVPKQHTTPRLVRKQPRAPPVFS